MDQFFSDGRVVDVILAVMVVEAAALVVYHRATGRGLSAGHVLSLMLPGAALVLALRAALLGAPWVHMAGWLVVALAAHLADIACRIKQR